MLHQGVINSFLVDDLLLDTGCSKTIVRRDLVGEERWLEGESTVIQCAHGDAIAYPLATIELEMEVQYWWMQQYRIPFHNQP